MSCIECRMRAIGVGMLTNRVGVIRDASLYAVTRLIK